MDWWTGIVESQIQQKRGQKVTILTQKNIIIVLVTSFPIAADKLTRFMS